MHGDWASKLDKFHTEMEILNQRVEIINKAGVYNLIYQDKDWNYDVMAARSFLNVTEEGIKRQFEIAIMEPYEAMLATVTTRSPTPSPTFSIFWDDARVVRQGAEVGEVTVRENMHLEMSIKINSFGSNDWANIFLCGDGYYKYPGIWLSPYGNGFYFQFSDDSDEHHGGSTGSGLETGRWYKLEMDITETTFRVMLDNEIKYYEVKSPHLGNQYVNYDAVQCYLGSANYFIADGVEVQYMRWGAVNAANAAAAAGAVNVDEFDGLDSISPMEQPPTSPDIEPRASSS